MVSYSLGRPIFGHRFRQSPPCWRWCWRYGNLVYSIISLGYYKGNGCDQENIKISDYLLTCLEKTLNNCQKNQVSIIFIMNLKVIYVGKAVNLKKSSIHFVGIKLDYYKIYLHHYHFEVCGTEWWLYCLNVKIKDCSI
jgi:hypothetical protein